MRKMQNLFKIFNHNELYVKKVLLAVLLACNYSQAKIKTYLQY